ncbi:MAG: hypothetical protein ACKVON_03920 [Beijerinckiaceae bacterium]
MILHDIATARAGDKGNASQIAVIARDPAHYGLICEKLTAELVAKVFAGIAAGPVTRHEAPGLSALVFILENALGGGVSISLASDPHGKSLSSLMLGIRLE